MTHGEESQVSKDSDRDIGKGNISEQDTSPDQKLTSKRTFSRRDLIIAGIGGLAGVATGALGTVVTTYVQERARASLASDNLVVYPEANYIIAGHWEFYSRSPIDLAMQPDIDEGLRDDRLVSYLVKNGCVRVSPLMVILHLSRPGDSAAIVRNIEISNHRKLPLIDDVHYLSEGAGGSNNAVFAIDLDQRNPRFVSVDLGLGGWDPSDVQGKQDVFSTSTFSVGPHVTESITLVFLASQHMHEFMLRIQYFVEGRENSVDISLAGLPFRVTPIVEKPKQAYCVPWYDRIYKLVSCTSE